MNQSSFEEANYNRGIYYLKNLICTGYRIDQFNYW